MKKNTIITILCLLLATIVQGQKKEALLLPFPEDWKYEKIDLPLAFAPEMKHKGFEELRFGPGMFDTTSESYFTYLFAVAFEKTTKFNKRTLKDFILQYYRGLCAVVDKSNTFGIDYDEIKVTIRKARTLEGRSACYVAELVFFDAFTNGQKILLNMNLELTIDNVTEKTYLLALVSPQNTTHPIWKFMKETRRKLYRTGYFVKS